MKKTKAIFQIEWAYYSVLCSLLFMMLAFDTYSQKLSGNLEHHANQEIKLLGYEGFETVEIAKSVVNESGDFTLFYNDYNGMGYLETSDNSQLFMVIDESTIGITGVHLKEPISLKFLNSNENIIFSQYTVEHSQRERALAGWKYLLPQYTEVELLKQQKRYRQVIQKEIYRLEMQDQEFLNQLNKTTYISWFLPLRKLIDDIPLSAQRYTERIPKHIEDFRSINFKDPRLYNSGILDDLIESHYWLIENGGMTFDSMYQQMNISTDYLINNLEGNNKSLNEVSDFLFDLLEKRSLYIASEHLALNLLTKSSCLLEDELAKRMEAYRVMKVGNTAPDILFEGKKMLMGSEINNKLKLSDLKSTFTLVVFGASWCSQCTQDIPKIKERYLQWKMKGVETVFISLDNNENEFKNFVKDYPFLSSCDFKSWDNKAVKDYYVFAAPSLFLLDKNRKIILRPSSIDQVDAWVKYKSETKN